MNSISETVRGFGIPESAFDGLLAAGLAYAYTQDTGVAMYLGGGCAAGSMAFKAAWGEAGSDQDRYLRTAVCGATTAGASMLMSGNRPQPYEAAAIGVLGHIASQTLMYGDIVGTIGPLVL
jgi:hypothetical protein